MTPNNILNIKSKPKPPYGGWTIESHTPVGKVDLSKVVFHLEPEQESGSIKGSVLLERLKGKKCLDGALLDYLLEHNELIPDSWKRDKQGNTRYIFFWGTVYRHSDGSLCVRCLYWDDGEWHWGRHWLDVDWGGGNPAALSQDLSTSKVSTSSDALSLAFGYLDAAESSISKAKELIKQYHAK